MILDGLEAEDCVIQSATLALIPVLATESNVDMIVHHLVQFLGRMLDGAPKAVAVGHIMRLADQFALSKKWYITTMNTAMAIGGSHFKEDSVRHVIRVIGQSAGIDGLADLEFRAHCVQSYCDLLDTHRSQWLT